MQDNHKLSGASKLSYGLGAVGKDMVYMLSASYVLYYFQDVIGVSAIAMGIILLAARIFDAFNDPIMGVIVAKTKTRWGKFRPWLLIGTLTNAIVLVLMFSAPPALDAKGLTAYAAVTYILWGVTYTMMDIPYWSMIPAFTEGGKERENLTTLARSCAGVGSAIITVVTVITVRALGTIFGGQTDKQIEILGFKYFSIVIAALFILFTILTCVNIKERSTAEMETVSVGQMFRALFQNDQALTVVVAIVLINCSIYITSNLVLYFFKYDFGGTEWFNDYTLFNIFGGAMQILAMMVLYPLLRKLLRLSNTAIFYVSLAMAMIGYGVLLYLSFTGMSNIYVLFIPAYLIFSVNGLLSILTTVFLANTVDYGELKNNRRDESVIFSMQTFVVKLASGIAAFIASLCLQFFALSSDAVSEEDKLIDFSLNVPDSSKIGLRMTMALVPVIGLMIALVWFAKKFVLNDKKVEEIAEQVRIMHAAEDSSEAAAETAPAADSEAPAEAVPETVSGATPGATEEITEEAPAEAVPEAVSGATPGVAEEAAEEAPAEAVPEAVSGATPEAAEEAAEEAAAEAVPEAVSGATPGAAEEAAEEAAAETAAAAAVAAAALENEDDGAADGGPDE